MPQDIKLACVFENLCRRGSLFMEAGYSKSQSFLELNFRFKTISKRLGRS